VLVFSQHDEAYQSVADVVAALLKRDVPVISAGPTPGGGCMALPCDPSLNPFATPIGLIQSFYPLAEAIAQKRGRNPDAPPHLEKVTETV
jgi:glucosamine--fructose-6-phosphate aminotransferase (isomerizing)